MFYLSNWKSQTCPGDCVPSWSCYLCSIESLKGCWKEYLGLNSLFLGGEFSIFGKGKDSMRKWKKVEVYLWSKGGGPSGGWQTWKRTEVRSGRLYVLSSRGLSSTTTPTPTPSPPRPHEPNHILHSPSSHHDHHSPLSKTAPRTLCSIHYPTPHHDNYSPKLPKEL